MYDKIPTILTRPEDSNQAFAASFPAPLARRLQFIESPLIRIKSIGVQIGMQEHSAALFTSVNGVRFAPPNIGRKAYCVGARTTQSAQAAGWKAQCVGQNAEEMVKTLIEMQPTDILYHLSGVHVRGRIVERLKEAGFSAHRVPLYDQLLMPLTPEAQTVLGRQTPVIVPLFSPRAATHFAAVAPSNPQVTVVTMSDAVTESLGKTPRFKAITASEPTSDAMISVIEKLVTANRLG